MTENDQPDAAVDLAELGRHFAEISGRLADQGELQPERVISFAADVVPHASHCGITLLRQGRQPELVAASDAVAEAVDLLQYATGEGPCLDAADDNDAVRTPDVGADPRWPVFGPACVRRTGVRSVLSWAPDYFLNTPLADAFFALQEPTLPWILVLVYVVLALPFVYRALDAGVRGADLRTLTEAARKAAQDAPA